MKGCFLCCICGECSAACHTPHEDRAEACTRRLLTFVHLQGPVRLIELEGQSLQRLGFLIHSLGLGKELLPEEGFGKEMEDGWKSTRDEEGRESEEKTQLLISVTTTIVLTPTW